MSLWRHQFHRYLLSSSSASLYCIREEIKKKESNFIKSKCSIAEIVPKNVFLKNSFILNIVCI